MPIKINSKCIHYVNIDIYLGMTIGTKLRWEEHTNIKIKNNNELRKMDRILGRRFELSLDSKLLF